MNVERLRRDYDKLTPFERAGMIVQEAVGRQREAEIDALVPDTLYCTLWTTAWEKAFLAVAAYAMFRACYSEKLFLQVAYFADAKGADATMEAPKPEYVCRIMDAAAGWIAALQCLAKETGAPLLEASKLLDHDYADNLLAYAQKCQIDNTKQLAALRKVWNAAAKYPNSEDAGRACIG